MTLTKAGRDREAMKFAIRYLGKLRAAMKPVAPASDSGWLSEYAVGFVTSHVAVGMLVAAKRLEFAKPSAQWPDKADVFALANELAPAQMGFQPLAFRRALADVSSHFVPLADDR